MQEDCLDFRVNFDQKNSISERYFVCTEPSEEEPEPNGVENTDFVLYVSAVETERCKRGLTVAYASHCQQESALDRYTLVL